MPGKPVSPPLLPQDVLVRIVRLAGTDGRLLMVIATTVAIFATLIRDLPGTVAGVMAAGAGAVELHGVNRLRTGNARGMRWLVGSQLILLLVIWGYVMARLMMFDAAVVEELLTPSIVESFENSGVARADIAPAIKWFYQLGYGAVALAALLYQGGLAWYFLRRRSVVCQALAPSTRELGR